MLEVNVNLQGKTVLVTGAAGFVGSNLVMKLLECERDVTVVGIDSLNDYYDVSIKEYRLKEIEKSSANSASRWIFIKGNIADRDFVEKIFTDYDISVCVNLAAQAGVRYSIENPFAYVESNVVGFLNILECCRHNQIKHLVYGRNACHRATDNNISAVITDIKAHNTSYTHIPV